MGQILLEKLQAKLGSIVCGYYSNSNAFFPGLPGTDKELELLVEENQEYGDIIINKNEDVYENLSLKTLSGLDWFKQFCSHARYKINTESDPPYKTGNARFTTVLLKPVSDVEYIGIFWLAKC